MKLVGYQIIEGHYPSWVSDTVTELGNDGYLLHGPLHVDINKSTGTFHYSQAMVKYESDGGTPVTAEELRALKL